MRWPIATPADMSANMSFDMSAGTSSCTDWTLTDENYSCSFSTSGVQVCP